MAESTEKLLLVWGCTFDSKGEKHMPGFELTSDIPLGRLVRVHRA